MRLSLGAHAVLGLAAVYVAGRLFIHSWSCRYRLHRACRRYEAGDIAEGDRIVAAVERSVAAFSPRKTALAGWAARFKPAGAAS